MILCVFLAKQVDLVNFSVPKSSFSFKKIDMMGSC
jgi:hypothetical protein